MFDNLKKEVKSRIIFQFMKNAKKPQYIEILKLKKEIPENFDEFEMNFVDNSMNEYKIYDCSTKYLDKEQTNSVSIYYNQTNYFQCGDGNHSVEIIFSDFLNKSIKSEDCSIEYNGVKYFPKEDFGLSTRKRINFLNVDMNKFTFPCDINNKEVKINTLDNKNFLILISIIDKPKLIAIYLNNPFIEKKLKYTEDELNQILDSSLDSIKNVVYVNQDEEYMTYDKRCTTQILDFYQHEIIKSYEIEKKISEYFLIPREELNAKQIKIYDKYSEFMTYFPDLGQNNRQYENKTLGKMYYHQYYFSKLSLIKLENSIPKKVSDSDRVKLKYSACRCLRTLLKSGDGWSNSKLFEFRDFTEKGTIYYEANLFNKKFIDLLSEKSEIFLFFLQINSGSGINLLTNEFMSRISMLNEKNIKDNLFSTIPKYALKIKSRTKFNACTFNEVKITCINESSALGQDLEIDSLLVGYDGNYNLRYLLSNLMQHEDFGHITFSINFYAFYDEKIERPPDIHYSENLSPFKYYMINAKKEQIQEIVKEEKILKTYVPQEEEKKEVNEKKIEDNNQEIKNKVNIECIKGKKEDKEEINEAKNEKKEDYEVSNRDIEEKKDNNEGKNKASKQKNEGENRKDNNEEKKEEHNIDNKEKKEEHNIDNKEKKEEHNIDNKEEEANKKNIIVIEEIKVDNKRNNESNEEKKEGDIHKKRGNTNEDYKEINRIVIKEDNNKDINQDNFYEKKQDSKNKLPANKEGIKSGEEGLQKENVEKKGIKSRKKRREKQIVKEEAIIKGESGIALAFFLTRGKYQLMKLLRTTKIDFKELFEKPELIAAENLNEFIDKLDEIYDLNYDLFKYDVDAQIEYKTRFQNSSDSTPIPYGIPTLEKFN